MTKAVAVLAAAMDVAAVLTGSQSSRLLAENAPTRPTVSGSASSIETDSIHWVRSLEDGKAEATRTGRPLFANFCADWCIPCHLVDRTTFRDPQVVAAMRAFIAVKTDCTKSEMGAAEYKTRVLGSANMPYLTFLDSVGNHLPAQSIEGYADTATLLAALQSVASHEATR